MFRKKNILLLGGAAVLAYFLFRKKKPNSDTKQKVVSFDPTSVESMPLVAIPNAFPEIKIEGKSNY